MKRARTWLGVTGTLLLACGCAGAAALLLMLHVQTGHTARASDDAVDEDLRTAKRELAELEDHERRIRRCADTPGCWMQTRDTPDGGNEICVCEGGAGCVCR